MADVTPMRTAAETALLERFPAVKSRLPGDAAIARLRQAAFDRFAARGLPSRRVEEWKYTDLRAQLRETPPLAEAPGPAAVAASEAAPNAFAAIKATRVTFVDGYLVSGLSGGGLPAGLSAVRLADALATGHPLVAELMGRVAVAEDPALALNAAFMADGIVLDVAPGTNLSEPLLLRFVVTGTAPVSVYPRVLLRVGEGASVMLVEEHDGPDGVAYQSNAVVEIAAGDKVSLRHVRLNRQGSAAVDLSTLGVRLGAESQFTALSFVSRPALSRHQIFVTFAGENSTMTLAGASLLKGRQHADTTLVVDHAVPHCESRELFKNVLDGEATGVFQGKIIVQPGAQKTDGRMMSQAVLLADGATMNNKPELEIFADDVQCAHGATCGALDDDLIFYLQSRGLPRPEAEALMLQAFVGEALETIEHEGIREALEADALAWLSGRT
jgi:Fe-S cluster assembly protein SufD